MDQLLHKPPPWPLERCAQALLWFWFIIAYLTVASPAAAQIDEDQPGAWYMYFFNAPSSTSAWGVQGDVQYRNWDLADDLEQLLLRGGVTWRPQQAAIMFTLGAAHITTGEFGASNDTTEESRLYQEALMPQRLGARVYLRHRIRSEQRWVQGQAFRTRYRYALFADVPLNQSDLRPGAWYLSLYNEVFINGERDIGAGRTVDVFDRNRSYAALGRSFAQGLRIQLGYMHQRTETLGKGQLQVSLHQTF